MRRFSYAISRISGFFILMLVIGPPSASALPPASGSKCKSNWVNNAAAMDCFIQGEEDVRNGVTHPHYVACTSAGETFCCVDNDHGGQDCEVAARTDPKRPIEALQMAAILDAQETILTLLSRICAKVDCKAPDVNRK